MRWIVLLQWRQLISQNKLPLNLSSKEEDEQLSLKGSLAAVRKSARAAALIQAVPTSQFFPSKTNKEQQWYFWSFTWPSCPWFFEHSSKQRSLRRLLTFCSWKNPAKVSWMEGKGRFFEDTQSNCKNSGTLIKCFLMPCALHKSQ